MKHMDRRSFIRSVGMALAAVPAAVVVSQIGRVAPATADALKPLDPSFPMAKALAYAHDAAKADPEKRTLPEMKDRFCSNCALYQQGGQKLEGQAGEWGKCGLFPQGLVASNGWCMSWAAKPA
jgi:High potential iron-sulfur protein